jgi:hypothetical protein
MNQHTLFKFQGAGTKNCAPTAFQNAYTYFFGQHCPHSIKRLRTMLEMAPGDGALVSDITRVALTVFDVGTQTSSWRVAAQSRAFFLMLGGAGAPGHIAFVGRAEKKKNGGHVVYNFCCRDKCPCGHHAVLTHAFMRHLQSKHTKIRMLPVDPKRSADER